MSMGDQESPKPQQIQNLGLDRRPSEPKLTEAQQQQLKLDTKTLRAYSSALFQLLSKNPKTNHDLHEEKISKQTKLLVSAAEQFTKSYGNNSETIQRKEEDKGRHTLIGDFNS